MNLTEAAQQQLDCVLGPGEYLEIGLKTGGCSGATITMDKVAMNTTESNTKDYVVWADTISQTTLGDGELDYVSDGLMASFVVRPPEGIQSCGCGNSIVLG